MLRTIQETRVTGRLANRGCRVLDLVRLSDCFIVFYQDRAGRVKYRKYSYGKGK